MTSKTKIFMLENLNHVLNVCFFLAMFYFLSSGKNVD